MLLLVVIRNNHIYKIQFFTEVAFDVAVFCLSHCELISPH